MEKKTAEEFIREKIREKNSFPEKYEMEALHRYSVTGEDCLRWAHDYASQSPNQEAVVITDEMIESLAHNYITDESTSFCRNVFIDNKCSFIEGFKACQKPIPNGR